MKRFTSASVQLCYNRDLFGKLLKLLKTVFRQTLLVHIPLNPVTSLKFEIYTTIIRIFSRTIVFQKQNIQLYLSFCCGIIITLLTKKSFVLFFISSQERNQKRSVFGLCITPYGYKHFAKLRFDFNARLYYSWLWRLVELNHLNSATQDLECVTLCTAYVHLFYFTFLLKGCLSFDKKSTVLDIV